MLVYYFKKRNPRNNKSKKWKMANDSTDQMLECEITGVLESTRRRLQGAVDIDVEVWGDFILVALDLSVKRAHESEISWSGFVSESAADDVILHTANTCYTSNHGKLCSIASNDNALEDIRSGISDELNIVIVVARCFVCFAKWSLPQMKVFKTSGFDWRNWGNNCCSLHQNCGSAR